MKAKATRRLLFLILWIFGNGIYYSNIDLSRLFATQRQPTPDSDLLHQNGNVSACERHPPSFVGKKGIVLFYHIGKTGGSTIRSVFDKLQHEEPDGFQSIRWFNQGWKDEYNETGCSLPSRTLRQLWKLDTSIRAHFDNAENPNVQLLELHGSVPGMTYLAPYIHEWRKLAQSRNLPFFAFTLVRDPVQLSVSYFRFFHVDCPDKWCEPRQFNETKEGLIESARLMPNRQCTSLHQRQSFTLLKPEVSRTCEMKDCESVAHIAEQSLDWIGTTERLSYDTLPLLSHMLTAKDFVNVTSKNVAPPDTNLQNLTVSEHRELEGLLDMDLKLYDRVRTNYVVDRVFCFN